MSEQPLVSIILPTHNRAKMLRRAINSVLRQTIQGFELIVVSDGSKDDTEQVVKSFKDPRIRLLTHDTSRGASAARNTGLKVSKGRYIAFLDDDDLWTPNKLAIQIPAIENSDPGVGLIYAWMEYVRDGRVVNARKPTLKGNVFTEMLDKQAIGGCPTIIIKREVLDVVYGFDERLPRGNDGDFMRRVTKHFEVDYVPEVLCKVYVGHADRISVNSLQGLRNEVLALEDRLQKFASDFAEHPEKKAEVLLKIAIDHLSVSGLRRALSYLRAAIRNCHTTSQRIRMIARFSRLSAAKLLRKLGNFATRDSV